MFDASILAADKGAQKAPGCFKVAIITRTTDCSILLERAAKSVSAQTVRDCYWVVVHDGGMKRQFAKLWIAAVLTRAASLLCLMRVRLGIECTFARLARSWRLSKDGEQSIASSTAWAHITLNPYTHA